MPLTYRQKKRTAQKIAKHTARLQAAEKTNGTQAAGQELLQNGDGKSTSASQHGQGARAIVQALHLQQPGHAHPHNCADGAGSWLARQHAREGPPSRAFTPSFPPVSTAPPPPTLPWVFSVSRFTGGEFLVGERVAARSDGEYTFVREVRKIRRGTTPARVMCSSSQNDDRVVYDDTQIELIHPEVWQKAHFQELSGMTRDLALQAIANYQDRYHDWMLWSFRNLDDNHVYNDPSLKEEWEKFEARGNGGEGGGSSGGIGGI